MVVLVAGHDEHWSLHRAELGLKVVERWTLHLHAAHRVRRAEIRMQAETFREELPAARILVLELHPGRALGVGRSKILRSARLEIGRDLLRHAFEVVLVRLLGPVACPRRGHGEYTLGVP